MAIPCRTDMHFGGSDGEIAARGSVREAKTISPTGPWDTFAGLLLLLRVNWNRDDGRFDALPFVERQCDLGNPTADRTINPHRVEAVVPSLFRKCDLGDDGLAAVFRRVLSVIGHALEVGVGVEE